MKIYCPQCSFEPTPDMLWQCIPGCHFQWHTFDTRGQCPNCFKWWRVTQCPACGQWSKHDDWYHETAPEVTEKSTIEVTPPVTIPSS